MATMIGDWTSAAVLLAVLIYTAVYFARSPWRTSLLTVIFAIKNLLVVLYMVQVQASVWLGNDYLLRWIARPSVNALCAVAYLTLAALLWHLQTKEIEKLRFDLAQFKAEEDEARAEQETRAEADE
jgi:peptidoglycan biosynthesis protein MviN/MurJ (putative lipid II flippase)